MTNLKEVSGDFTQLCKKAGGRFDEFEEEFRQAQLELKESRQNYADLFDHAPAGYFVFSRKGLLEKVNRAGEKMLGTHEDTMEGRPVLTFFPKASYPAFFDHLAGAFAMGNKQVCELELLRADGSTFWAQFVTAPITNAAGDFVHFRTIIVDITDRRC